LLIIDKIFISNSSFIIFFQKVGTTDKTKKGENYENIMFENFDQEKIPKILISDLSKLMNYYLYEERKSKHFYNKEMKDNLNSKIFLQNVINQWLSIKTFKNHLECKN
jgi:hypothetical protein